jgi:hypothetical protein
MSKLDEAISESLSEEDADFLARFEKEPGSFQQFFGIFNGPFAWISSLFALVMVLLLAFTVLAGWKFWVTTDIRGMLLWGAGALAALLIMIVIRIWFFLEIQTNRVLREVKRLELQLARQMAR